MAGIELDRVGIGPDDLAEDAHTGEEGDAVVGSAEEVKLGRGEHAAWEAREMLGVPQVPETRRGGLGEEDTGRNG